MPGWRPHCLRGSIYEAPHYSITPKNAPDSQEHDLLEERKGTLLVELQKKEGCGLGLTVTGGVDKGQKPVVSNLRPGSIAHRCDSLVVGDHILSVNGIRTGTLRHEEVINLLKNAGTTVTLEVEYDMPESSLPSSNIHCKVHEVMLDKEQSGFGMTLRGGMLVETMRAHPLTVVAVRNGGPAHREGSIRPGDHIVAINGYKVTHLSLAETLSLFDQCDTVASFSVAYNVYVQESVESASGPVFVELERTPGTCVGLSLSHSENDGQSCFQVEHVQPMSAADRDGSLRPGDIILSIDGANVENMSVAEALQLLKSGTEPHVNLGIIPFTHLERRADRDYLSKNSLRASFSSHTLPVISPSSTILSNMSNHQQTHYHHHNNNNSNNNANHNAREIMSISSTCSERGGPTHSFADSSSVSVGASPFGTLNLRKRSTPSWPTSPHRRATSCMSIASSTAASVLSSTNQVCHSETTEVILFADHKGLGLTLKGGIFTSAPLSEPPVISSVVPRSAADKCGVLQEGDRVLSVNGMDTIGHSLDEVNRFLSESRPRCVLVTEFDVTESVTLSSGTYIVKLAKKASDTGITVHSTPCSKSSKDSLFISDVRKGSVAHRTGSVQPGDKLLAINDVRLDTCTSEDAMHLLELPDDIVKLKLKREDPDEGNEGFIIYTVELQRFGGPLGITISGTEDPMDPIVISELTQHGLADRTGAIHVGDRLLAVSGNPTKNKPLSEAIRMLQSAGDIVTLKIARPDPSQEGGHLHINPFGSSLVPSSPCKPSTPIPSIDSAVDSWGSSANDVRAHTNSWHDIRSRGSSTHDVKSSEDISSEPKVDGAVALAVPQLTSFLTRPKSNGGRAAVNEDYHKPQQELEGKSDMSFNQSKDASSKNDGIDNEENTDASSSSSNMDEWFKTLEEFDMGSGSEMLRQIGLSLRERSSASTDHQHHNQIRSSRADNSETTGFGIKQRSKSASRFSQGPFPSTSLDNVKSRGSKPPISKKPDLKALRDKKPGCGTLPTKSNAVTSDSSIAKTSDSDTDSSSQRPALPPRSAKTLPAAKSQSMSNGFSGQRPPVPAKPKFSTFTSNSEAGIEQQESNGLPKAKDQIQTIFTPSPLQLQRLVLEKKSPVDEFGFSLSDALDGCGVYVSNVRSGSLAEDAGLKSYDRVLQVNKTKTKESDCSTVVPMIANSGKRLSLVVCRNPLLPKESERTQRAAQSAERESTHSTSKSRYTLPMGLSTFIARSSKTAAIPAMRNGTQNKD